MAAYMSTGPSNPCMTVWNGGVGILYVLAKLKKRHTHRVKGVKVWDPVIPGSSPISSQVL